MPGSSFTPRSGSELDESLLDALLDGQPLAADAPQQAHLMAGLFASLAGPADPGDLAGEAAARAAFARAAAPADVWPDAPRPARRRLSILRPPARWAPARVRARLAAGLTAAAVGLCGAAAYAGALPGPIQDFAHHVIGAPAARHAPGGSHPSQQAGQPSQSSAAHPVGHPRPRPAKPGNAKAAKQRAHGKAKGHGKAKAHGKANGHGKAGHGKAKGHGKPTGHGKAKGHGKQKSGKARSHATGRLAGGSG